MRSLSARASTFQLLNQTTEFHKTLQKNYATEEHMNDVSFNFKHSVMTLQACEPLR
jgi:hypothetical protein